MDEKLKRKIVSLIKDIKSDKIKSIIKLIYYGVFDRFSFLAHRDYMFTDEQLKFTHILEAVNYLRIAEMPRVYFEFGCHSGRTFSAAVRAAKYLKMEDAEFYAFDSFQGLPDTNQKEDGVFESGTFSTGVDEFIRVVRKRSGLQMERKNIVEGYYDQSLTSKLQLDMPKVGVVHIDVDLYSSTVDVLKFIKPHLVVGSVLIFDDWYCFAPGANMGEKRAFEEFCEANPAFELESWKSYSTFGKSFFVTAIP